MRPMAVLKVINSRGRPAQLVGAPGKTPMTFLVQVSAKRPLIMAPTSSGQSGSGPIFIGK
ncbi:hypothetical protein BOTNAR_0196g00100 [Botryotinia narcissicola]|uniref:Uncharacterized protein n=1 Tax=Botryotinia narcissicola TaxID=278944 RepID=A0A4Z1I7Y3_9HELO|nr:hypothetical protein BOTNAR_0196g00100 [Botryotinia narcissicola]